MRFRRFRLFVTNECPVFTPLSEILVGPGDNSASFIDRVIKTLGPDAKSDSLVESVFQNLHRLDRGYRRIIDNIPQFLPAVSIDPVLVHLEDVVGFVRPRSFPVQGRPGSLQLVENQASAFLKLIPGELRIVPFKLSSNGSEVRLNNAWVISTDFLNI